VRTIDIETIPTAAALLAPYPEDERNAPGNYKSDEAIAKWRAADRESWAAERVKVCSLSPRLGRVVAVGHTTGTEEPTVLLAKAEEEETDVIRTAWGLMLDAPRPGVVTFNGAGFDVPFLMVRSLILGIKVPPEVPRDYLRRYTYAPHLDVRMALTGWDSRAPGTLGDWCEAFGIERPVGHGSEVYPAYLAGEWDSIIAHCRADVRATSLLAERIAPTFWGP